MTTKPERADDLEDFYRVLRRALRIILGWLDRRLQQSDTKHDIT